jgi:hypothetical protein
MADGRGATLEKENRQGEIIETRMPSRACPREGTY